MWYVGGGVVGGRGVVGECGGSERMGVWHVGGGVWWECGVGERECGRWLENVEGVRRWVCGMWEGECGGSVVWGRGSVVGGRRMWRGWLSERMGVWRVGGGV